MKTCMYGMLAETPIHPGAGQSSGFVDLPVAREAATDYPVIVGSSMKGALLSAARDRIQRKEVKDFDIEFVFGEHDNAGALLVSDARLLLLPIRSLTSHFMWVTCPHLIERYVREHFDEVMEQDRRIRERTAQEVSEQRVRFPLPEGGPDDRLARLRRLLHSRLESNGERHPGRR